MSRVISRVLGRRWLWPSCLIAVAVGGFLFRLSVFHTNRQGGYDLQIYKYFSSLALDGANPYTAPASGPVPGVYGDNQPFEFLLLAGVLRLHRTTETLRVFFALLEPLAILVIGFGFVNRSKAWRLTVAVLIAFNPFLALSWSGITEDKPLTILLLVCVLAALQRGALSAAWSWSAVLFIVKWVSLFYAAPLWLYSVHRRSLGYAAAAGAAFIAAGVIGVLPWFPESLRALSRRNSRLDARPDGQSVTVLLQRIGVYNHTLVRPAIILALLIVYALFLFRRINIEQAVVLSVCASFIFLPDETTDRVAQIALPLVFVIALNTRRLVALAVAYGVAAVAVQGSTFDATSRFGTIPPWAMHTIGSYGSVANMLAINLPLFVGLVIVGSEASRPRGEGFGRSELISAESAA